MIAGSSIVAGGVYARPAAMSRIVARRILPERVFGSRATTRASRKQATGPMRSRTSATSSSRSSAGIALGARP